MSSSLDTTVSGQEIPSGVLPPPNSGDVMAAQESPLGQLALPEECRFMQLERLRSISAGVYRSGYPFPEHYGYTHKILGLKTILILSNPDKVPRGGELADFCKTSGINHHVIPMNPTNYPGGISLEHMREAMGTLLDESKHPILVHCANGIHRTGTVIGVYQRLASELSMDEIHKGYDVVASDRAREVDKNYIAKIDVEFFKEHHVIGFREMIGAGEIEVIAKEDVGKAIN